MPNQPRENGITQDNGSIEDHYEWGSPCLCGYGPGHLAGVHWPGDLITEAFFPPSPALNVASFSNWTPEHCHSLTENVDINSTCSCSAPEITTRWFVLVC